MTRTRLRALGVVETPERPGPGPMPEPLLRALELAIGRRVDGLLAGDHRSHLLGRGSELAQIRPYVPGDDVRLIDWNVTARTSEPHIRVQLAERVLVTWVVLDRTPSMEFGTADRRKADVALGVALALGHAASLRGNRVGLVSFGAGSAAPLPPRQGRAGLVDLLLALGDEGTGRGRRSWPRALSLVAAVARQRALVAVVSDFRGPRDWRRPLVDLAARHDILAVEIRDPREERLVDVGEVWFADPESGQRLRIDTGDAGLRSRFAEAAARERREVATDLAAAQASHVVLSTSGDWLRMLAAHLGGGAGELRDAAGAVRAPRGARPRRARVARGAPPPEPARALRHACPRRGLGPGAPRLRRLLPLALALVALAALIVGLARPRATLSVPGRQATVILALDSSRSMAATDVKPSRLAAALAAAKTFLDVAPKSYSVGIVSFSTRASLVLSPTTDRDAARRALDQITLGSGTAIGDAIDRSVAAARPEQHAAGSRAGEERGPGDGPAALGWRADVRQPTAPRCGRAGARLGIPVNTVALGTREAVVDVPRPAGSWRRSRSRPTRGRCARSLA